MPLGGWKKSRSEGTAAVIPFLATLVSSLFLGMTDGAKNCVCKLEQKA